MSMVENCKGSANLDGEKIPCEGEAGHGPVCANASRGLMWSGEYVDMDVDAEIKRREAMIVSYAREDLFVEVQNILNMVAAASARVDKGLSAGLQVASGIVAEMAELER